MTFEQNKAASYFWTDGGLHEGLQRHTAIELPRHHQYMNYYSPVQPAMTSNTHVLHSIMPVAGTCRCGMMQPLLEPEIYPNNIMENLTMFGYSNTGDGPQPHKDIVDTKQLVHLQDSFHTAYTSPISLESNHQKGFLLSQLNEERPAWQMAHSSSSVAVCKDPAFMASFALDMELETRKQQKGRNPELRSQMPPTQSQSANFSPLQSNWPKYNSFNNVQTDGTVFHDRSVVQSAEMELNNCSLGPVDVNNKTEGCPDNMVCANEYTVNDDDKTSLSLGQSDNYYSIMEGDESILVGQASGGMKTHNGGVDTGPVITDRETVAAMTNTEEKSTSPVSRVPTCDTMVGTELVPSVSAFTQTDHPKTADKHIVTEVHMADLDYLAAEFVRLKTAQEQLQEKEKLKSLGYKLRKGCDCVQRAEQAELCLLALQYNMCRQHCWRIYYTFAEGHQFPTIPGDMNQCWPRDPPAGFLSILQKLESDYNQMREKILKGVPLEQLKPLSVDSETLTTAKSYIPAQMIGNVWEKCPPWSSQDPQKHNTSGDKNGCQGCSQSETSKKNKAVEDKNVNTRRLDTIVPQCKGANHDAHRLEEKQTKLITSEAWYDAEEDLEPAGSAAAGIGEDTNIITKDRTYETTNEEVSSLPSNVTERAAQALTNTLFATKTQPPKTDPSNTERKLVTQPPVNSSIKTRKVVCVSPTAKGTCVPQHYGTMGSFDTLMAELTQRHPDVGRQRIVNALVELRAKHQGVLSGLPIRTIREMTSELLIRPASVVEL